MHALHLTMAIFICHCKHLHWGGPSNMEHFHLHQSYRHSHWIQISMVSRIPDSQSEKISKRALISRAPKSPHNPQKYYTSIFESSCVLIWIIYLKAIDKSLIFLPQDSPLYTCKQNKALFFFLSHLAILTYFSPTTNLYRDCKWKVGQSCWQLKFGSHAL